MFVIGVCEDGETLPSALRMKWELKRMGPGHLPSRSKAGNWRFGLATVSVWTRGAAHCGQYRSCTWDEPTSEPLRLDGRKTIALSIESNDVVWAMLTPGAKSSSSHGVCVTPKTAGGGC